jgi:hypothetical protein
VEELAAAERADRSSRSDRTKRPMMIAIAVGVLLAAGAGAFAVLRTGQREPTFQAPIGAAAPFGIGYVDGFGEHTPKPTPTSHPSRNPAKSPTFGTSPAGLGGGAALFSSPSAGTDLAQGPSAPDNETVVSGLSAVYWAQTWKNAYQMYMWVHNDGPETVKWELNMQLPAGATVTRYWEVDGVGVGAGSWQFTSSSVSGLGPGRTYLFAFEGRLGPEPFRVYSCSVNGASCTEFR